MINITRYQTFLCYEGDYCYMHDSNIELLAMYTVCSNSAAGDLQKQVEKTKAILLDQLCTEVLTNYVYEGLKNQKHTFRRMGALRLKTSVKELTVRVKQLYTFTNEQLEEEYLRYFNEVPEKDKRQSMIFKLLRKDFDLDRMNVK